MKLLSALLCGVLGAGLFFMAAPSSARADSPETRTSSPVSADAPLPVPAQPGTLDEARTYEQRQEQSPEVQEFSGGAVYIGVGVFFLVLVILLVILLSHHGDH